MRLHERVELATTTAAEQPAEELEAEDEVECADELGERHEQHRVEDHPEEKALPLLDHGVRRPVLEAADVVDAGDDEAGSSARSSIDRAHALVPSQISSRFVRKR